MNKSGIEWTDRSDWNPTTGCDPCSPGCANCYAELTARTRLAGRCGYPPYPHHFDVTLHHDRLLKPLGWRKPQKVFINSMGDPFHPGVPFEFVDKVWVVMAACPHLTFQMLTKRPERMREYVNLRTQDKTHRINALEWLSKSANDMAGGDWTRPHPSQDAYLHAVHCWEALHGSHRHKSPWPLPNVWLGATCCTQAELDRNAQELRATPAALRFVSLEPLLEDIDIGRHSHRLDWVIVGAESGSKRRPCNIEWVRSIRDQCLAARVPLMIKQYENEDGKLLTRCPPLDGVVYAQFPEVAA